MKNPTLILFLVYSLLLVSSPLFAQEAKVTSLMSKPVPDNPGKELLMISVEYPPGGSDPAGTLCGEFPYDGQSLDLTINLHY